MHTFFQSLHRGHSSRRIRLWLYYYRARYHSPQLGRFISEDPIGIGGGGNFYLYVDGDPISEVDPIGLWSISGSFYAGVGGGFFSGKSHGCRFLGLRIGLGKGFSIGYDPEGSFPGIPSTPPGSYRFTIAATVKGGVRVGPWGAEAEEGIVRDYGTHQSNWTHQATLASIQGLWGVEAERSLGIDVTSYVGGRCGCSN